MTYSGSSRGPVASGTNSTHNFDRAVAPAFVVATALTVGLVFSRAHGLGLESVVLAWMMWTVIGLTLCTRGLWDQEVAARGTPFRRLGRTVGKWYGWVGLLVTTALIAGWLAATPTNWLTSAIYGSVAVVATLMLFVRGVVRKIGAGILVACAAPGWTYIAVLFGFYLLIPTVLTFFAAIGCSIAEIQMRKSRRPTPQWPQAEYPPSR